MAAPASASSSAVLIGRLAVAWGSVMLLTVYGEVWLADLAAPLKAIGLFIWLFVVIGWCAQGVVREADHLAHMLGEPLGTVVLTLAIVIIEVVLIAAVMLAVEAPPTLGRDTMFAVLMIVLNLVVGIMLLAGGWRHREQAYNLHGAIAYLGVIVPLAVLSMILPNFLGSRMGASLTPIQAFFFSLLTILLYGLFLAVQTVRHRGFFTEPGGEGGDAAFEPQPPAAAAALLGHVLLLVATMLPIVLLAKGLARLLDHGISVVGAPPALGGVLIALIVFTPEAVAALRAALANQLQRSVNLCLGAAASTIGLTVPAILVIGLLTGRPVVLGLDPAEMVILALTLALSMLTFYGPRTTILEGAVHLVVFCVYLVVIFG